MKKQTIIVPKGINYISNWADFNLIPGHYIIDKKVTGCGFTQYCITNNLPTILCSPRKILLENKSEQHSNVHYVKNELEKIIEIDRDLTQDSFPTSRGETSFKLPKKSSNTIDIDEDEVTPDYNFISNMVKDIQEYVYFKCSFSNPPKILVTYDSLRYVLSALGPVLLKQFYVIVDEFQSIFTDSRFKGNVEMNFIEYLQDCPNVCYVSATPIMETYLNELDEFKNLPYYELDWITEDPRRVINPNIEVKHTKIPLKEVCNIINDYKSGKFEVAIGKNNFGIDSPIESTELVVYVNSVRMICTIIKRMKLTSEETNILCANTSKNVKRLKKIKHEIGSVPLQNQPHKMFTFCTRTVYLGADFYSKTARSVIISDSNIECMAVDISLDLPQILGRQRLDCNPWKNRALMFIKTTKSEVTQDKLDKRIEEKLIESNKNISIFNKVSSDEQEQVRKLIRDSFSMHHYNNNYSAISEKTGKVVINNLVLVAEKRAFEVIQRDYRDWVCVLNRINLTDIKASEVKDTPLEIEIKSFFKKFNRLSEFSLKMKLYCEANLSNEAREVVDSEISIDFSKFYKYLGSNVCRSNSYQKSELQREFKNRYIQQTSSLSSQITSIFLITTEDQLIFYPLKDIKEKLQQLYDGLGIKKKAKASDLENYFVVKEVVRKIDNKSTKGYYLLSIKK